MQRDSQHISHVTTGLENEHNRRKSSQTEKGRYSETNKWHGGVTYGETENVAMQKVKQLKQLCQEIVDVVTDIPTIAKEMRDCLRIRVSTKQ